MIVSTHGLVRQYGHHVALDGVDLAIVEGTTYGLVGRNGAGKTTLLSILAGLRRPSAGTVSLDVPRVKMAVCLDVPVFPCLSG